MATKVLLAEDSAPTRRMLEVTLQACGCEVVAVCDGQSAVETYEALRPSLVLLDWQMPVLDGIEVCRRIRALGADPAAFVLMITSRDAPGDLTSALEAGADDYVLKPLSAEQLRARVMIARHRIEERAARRRAEEALARAHWLAGTHETARALQHEINNPLLALTLAAELFNEQAAVSVEQREQSAAIVQQARRIADVVRRLSSMPNPQSVEYVAGTRMLDLSDGASDS